MVKIAIVVDGDYEFPIYKDNGKYYIDLGGSFGMSDPLSFDGDTKAISTLQRAYHDNPWEM